MCRLDRLEVLFPFSLDEEYEAPYLWEKQENEWFISFRYLLLYPQNTQKKDVQSKWEFYSIWLTMSFKN